MIDVRNVLIVAAVCCLAAVVQESLTFPVDTITERPEDFREKFLNPITKMLGNETTNKIVNDTTVIVKEAAGRIATQVGSDMAGQVAGKKMVQVATALLT